MSRQRRSAALLVFGLLLSSDGVATAADVPRAARAARTVSFDAGWRFTLGDPAGAERPGFDDASWRVLDLPHDWSIEDLPKPDGVTRSGPFDRSASAGKEATGWVVGGTGWYRKRFRLPATAKDRRAELVFDGSYMETEVWVNGRKAGENVYGYSTFPVDLTPHLDRAGENVVAVRVRNEGANSRWYSGSGLYRHVWLTTTGPLRVPLWGVGVTTPEVSATAATVKVAVELANDAATRKVPLVRVRLEPVDAGAPAVSGSSNVTVFAAGQATAQVALEVASPRLWSPDSPALYRAVVEIVDGASVVDRVAQTFGIRKVEIDAERGLRVNGRPYEMKGACVHHDNGPLGAAAIDRAEERRVEVLKAAGFDAIRTSHNPPSPAFLDAADRLGMLVIDEAFDMWQRPKNPQDYHRHFDEWWARDLARDGAPRPQPPERRPLEHRQRDPRAGRPARARDREAARSPRSAGTTRRGRSRTRSAASGTTRTGRGATPSPPSRSSTSAATTTSGSSTRRTTPSFRGASWRRRSRRPSKGSTTGASP